MTELWQLCKHNSYAYSWLLSSCTSVKGPLALLWCCFLVAASLLHLNLSQSTSLNWMYCDVDTFKRGKSHTQTQETVPSSQSPCQEAVGKRPQKELMKKESTQAIWAEGKTLTLATVLPEQTCLVLFPLHNSSLWSETNLKRCPHFLWTVVKIYVQDSVKTDPKVLTRPGKGKYPAVALLPTPPLQLKKKPESKQTGNFRSTPGTCPCSRPHV